MSLEGNRQDKLKAELELLASLADATGLVSAEQICAGEDISLEGLQGVEDVLLMLSVEYPEIIDRIAAQTSLTRKHGGKQWSAFQFEKDGTQWKLDEEDARAAFLQEVIKILDLPAHRKHDADWYSSIRTHPVTGDDTEMVHATIYVEAKAESELGFGPAETLERQVVQKVVEVGIACDPKEKILEICARGGKKVRDRYADAFATHFAPASDRPVEAPRREVFLEVLSSDPDFLIEPADGIERAEVSSLDFFSTGGGFARFEKRGDGETIYQFLDRRFGSTSPLRATGWQIVSATLRIKLAANEGKRARTLTVTLRTPNTTTLPNKTEADRQFVFDLLERWQIFEPLLPDVD